MVCIIAVRGMARNEELPFQVKEALPQSRVIVVEAVTPANIPPNDLAHLVTDSSKLLGRRIGDSEIAVMLSHRKSYECFEYSDSKYLLVLEDDVLINEKNYDELDLLNLLETQKPTVVSLYSPSWSIWRITKLGLQAKAPPAYAAAYFINRAGTRLALAYKPLGLADWPPWSIKTRFFYRNYFKIGCLQNESFLEDERRGDKKVKMKNVLFKTLPSDIERSWQFRFVIVYPLKWKLYKLIRLFASLKSTNDRIESWI